MSGCTCGCEKNSVLREKVRDLADKIKATLLELDTEVAVATGHGKEKVFPNLQRKPYPWEDQSRSHAFDPFEDTTLNAMAGTTNMDVIEALEKAHDQAQKYHDQVQEYQAQLDEYLAQVKGYMQEFGMEPVPDPPWANSSREIKGLDKAVEDAFAFGAGNFKFKGKDQWTEEEREIFRKQRTKDLAQIAVCADIMAKIEAGDVDHPHLAISLYGDQGGWRIRTNTIEAAGLDLDQVYQEIYNKAAQHKETLEAVQNLTPNEIVR